MGFARSTLVLKLLTLIILTSCQSPMTKVPTATWTPTHFTAPDGTEFPYSKWLPQRSPRAVILGIHGLGGAASDWRPLGEYFRERGIAVYAHELRGMGTINGFDYERHGSCISTVSLFIIKGGKRLVIMSN